MRIISQDKMSDVDYNNIIVGINVINENEALINIWSAHNNDEMGIVFNTFATYSTKEKALKVMDMIWQPRHWVSSNALIKDGDFVPGFERYVFYMPKDEDVE